jgi:hypothetical protein
MVRYRDAFLEEVRERLL